VTFLSVPERYLRRAAFGNTARHTGDTPAQYARPKSGLGNQRVWLPAHVSAPQEAVKSSAGQRIKGLDSIVQVF